MTFGGHFGSHIENIKNAYKQLFYRKIVDIHLHQVSNIIYYIVSSEINQNTAVEALNASCMSFPWTCFLCFDASEI